MYTKGSIDTDVSITIYSAHGAGVLLMEIGVGQCTGIDSHLQSGFMPFQGTCREGALVDILAMRMECFANTRLLSNVFRLLPTKEMVYAEISAGRG